MERRSIDIEQEPLLELTSIDGTYLCEKPEDPHSCDVPSTSKEDRPTRECQLLLSLRKLLAFVIPSFLKQNQRAVRKNGIAALDGFRDLACLAVFNEHFHNLTQDTKPQHWINRLPFLRLWRYGHGAVFLFFVISGYVLACKPLKQVRARDFHGFQKTISSSIFRRGLRLYTPCLTASAIMVFLALVGYFDWPHKTFNILHAFTLSWEPPPPNNISFTEHLALYWSNVRFIFCSTFPFKLEICQVSLLYDSHQWTIPVEFRGSMAIFTALVGTSRMHSCLRLCSHAVMFFYLYNTDRVYVSLFFAGMVCAELDLMRHDYYAWSLGLCPKRRTQRSLIQIEDVLRISDKAATTIYLFLFILGCWIMSSPNENFTAGNWLPYALSGFRDSYDLQAWDNLLLTVGSVLAVWAVANCGALGVIFNSNFVQYLGSISFALYLVHGLVIRSLGYVWMPMAFRIATATPWDKDLTLEWWVKDVSDARCVLAWCLGMAVVLPVVVWWADLFWTYVDTPVVSFGKWLETRLTVTGEVNANPGLTVSHEEHNITSITAQVQDRASLLAVV